MMTGCFGLTDGSCNFDDFVYDPIKGGFRRVTSWFLDHVNKVNAKLTITEHTFDV